MAREDSILWLVATGISCRGRDSPAAGERLEKPTFYILLTKIDGMASLECAEIYRMIVLSNLSSHHQILQSHTYLHAWPKSLSSQEFSDFVIDRLKFRHLGGTSGRIALAPSQALLLKADGGIASWQRLMCPWLKTCDFWVANWYTSAPLEN